MFQIVYKGAEKRHQNQLIFTTVTLLHSMQYASLQKPKPQLDYNFCMFRLSLFYFYSIFHALLILNGSQDFFLFHIFIYFFKYETLETHARAFLPFIILAVGSVNNTGTQ